MQSRRIWAGILGTFALGLAVANPAGAEPAVAEPAEPVVLKAKKPAMASVAVIAVDGSLSEGVGQEGIFADVSPRLHRLIERIDQAAGDKKVGALLLSIGSPDLGRGRAEEIRAAVRRVKAKGKPVSVHMLDAKPVHYLVAAAADHLTMAPAATLELTGVRAEVTFFKEMLDKLGVEAEILQVGEFKGAAEPLTRTGMSPQLRQQYEAFVGDLFEQLVEQVAADRRLPAERVRELIDRGVFTAEAAEDNGLVDRVGYEDEAIAALAARAKLVPPEGDGKEAGPKVVREYGKVSSDDDFSGIGGLVKLVDLLSGAKKGRSATASKKIAIVHLHGTIREQGGEGLMEAAGCEPVIKALREADKDEKVKAIVLRIDSPGGSALVSDLIWREAKRTAKPVVASLSDTAASGGYYVAVAADRIVAAPGTLTGSIGVVGGKMAVGGALERIGVRTDVVSRGRNAGWLSVQSPFSAHEREAFLGTMQDVYRLFTSKVAEGRRLPAERMPELAEGRVYTGRMARELGLVDRLGTLEDAIDEARELAGIGKEETFDRVLLPEPRGLFEELFSATGTSREPIAGLLRSGLAGTGFQPLVDAVLPDADALLLLATGRPLALLPARVRIR